MVPYSNLPKAFGTRSFIRGVYAPSDIIVMPPRRISGFGINQIFTEHKGGVVSRKIQNVSVYNARILFQTDKPNPSVILGTHPYHVMLAPASATNAGDGAQLDCSEFNTGVWVADSTAYELVVFEVYLNDGVSPTIP